MTSDRQTKSQHIPLKLALIVPFVLQLGAVVGITGWLSWQNGQRAVNDLATQLRQEVNDRIQDRLDRFLDTPKLIDRINNIEIRQGRLDLDDQKAVSKYFWQQMQNFPYMTFISYGSSANGEYIGISRQLETSSVKLTLSDDSGKRDTYSLDSQGNIVQLLTSIPGYDARKRPWYTVAVEEGKSYWYPIYKYVFFDSLGTGVASRVYDASGKFRGVISSDLEITQISQFLHSLKISRSGQAFIIERDGNLVATSNLEKLFILKGKEPPKRLSAKESQHPLVKATTQQLQQRFGSLSNIDSKQQIDFKISGERQFVEISPYKDSIGLDWLVVVVVPESDFMAQIDANTRSTFLLCLASLAGSILLGLLTSRWISQPILQLRDASKAIASGKLTQSVSVKGIKEIEDLGQSFNSMSTQLRDSFNAIETANSELEYRVEQRTLELQRANGEITKLNQQLYHENLRMGAELDVARRIQQMILPKPEELEIEGLDIAGYMEPAAEVGGDYYDVLHTDGIVTIGIGDVTGHGLESGILMLMTQTAVRTLKEVKEYDSVKFLDTINRTIYKNVQRMNSDKNLTLAILNYAEGAISISGQHEETIVVRKGGQVERIDTIDLGFPIGIVDEIAEFVSHTVVELQPGDGIVIYTDGIPEAENSHRKLYGIEPLCEVISLNWDKSASEIKDAIIADLRQFIGKQKLFDDITLLVLKRKEL